MDTVLDQIAGNQGEGLSGVLNQLFWGGLVVAVILSIFMIVRGGLEYMTSDIISSKETAKNRIKGAIGGLMLSFSTILILNTINPGLTNLSLKFPELKSVGVITFNGINLEVVEERGDGTTIVKDPEGQTYTVSPNKQTITPNVAIPAGSSEQELRDFFSRNGIGINKPPCNPGQTSCTNVQGLGQSAVQGVVKLKDEAKTNVMITGGTEPGHKTHGIGKSIVDLSYNNSTLNAWIKNNASSTQSSSIGTWYIHSSGPLTGTRFLDETVGTRHWHVVFP